MEGSRSHVTIILCRVQVLWEGLDGGAHLARVFTHDLDHVWHGEVHDIMSPGQFHDDIWPQEVVTLEEAGCEALVVFLFKEPCNQFFCNVYVPRFACVLHRILDGGKTKVVL